jgi:F0F1-type ATP synthase assembly protein I
MSDPYRDALPASKEEVDGLKERVATLEKRKPRTPFVLRLWHTLVVGIAGVVGTIFAFGYVYDRMHHDSGLFLSTNLSIGLFGAIAVVTAIASLVGLDHSARDTLGAPWKLR